MVFLPLINFFVRIDANVEMVVEQIVVRAIAAVFAAQDVGPSRRPFRWRQRRRGVAAAGVAAETAPKILGRGHLRLTEQNDNEGR